MKITINGVFPKFFEQNTDAENTVWKRHIEFRVAEKICVNAQSGKGKTTFVKFLTGFSDAYKGEIDYQDQNIRSFGASQWAKIRQTQITSVFQDLRLFPQLSLGENLMIKNKLTDYCSQDELKEWLAMVGLKDKWNQPCGTLSFGQQQRGAILRALCQPFQWIVLDEPFSHIDQENARKCWNLIQQQMTKNKAGMLLTALDNHNAQLNFAENSFFDRQFFL